MIFLNKVKIAIWIPLMIFLGNGIVTFSQDYTCIDFTTYPANYREVFQLSNQNNDTLFYGYVNNNLTTHSYGIYYGANDTMDFYFDDENQAITLTGYGFYGQYNDMKYSVNGSSLFNLNHNFPFIINGVSVNMDTIVNPYGSNFNWTFYQITFTGAINSISHFDFESGITKICSDKLSNETTSNVKNKGKGNTSIKIYPNPSHDQITITNCKNREILIFNGLGKRINSKTSHSDNANINIKKLKPGFYFIKILNPKNPNGITIKKIIKM